MAEVHSSYAHVSDPDVFREALAYSEANTGFTASLIERDYYCSLILQYFFRSRTSLVFKGGTCLSKVYVNFYRLSEDLDFVIPVAADISMAQRRAGMVPVKEIFDNAPNVISGMEISETLAGHNNSRQYIGCFSYKSVLVEKVEKIKVEIGLREPMILPPETREARTIAINPFTNLPLVPSFAVSAMAPHEMYAEKFRAAMTRREPAIRDFFDLFYAVHEGGLNIHDPDFLSLVKKKLEVPGNDHVDLSSTRKDELGRQLEGQLRPLLRPQDFARFILNETFEMVCNMAVELSI
jgi:predicted nucleotidyltransferase component of viral defense system